MLSLLSFNFNNNSVSKEVLFEKDIAIVIIWLLLVLIIEEEDKTVCDSILKLVELFLLFFTKYENVLPISKIGYSSRARYKWNEQG